MSVSEEVPPQWHQYFKAANFESFRDVATAADVAPSTVIACLKPGQRRPGSPTIEKVAAALRMTADKLRELRGDPEAEPFELPDSADSLGAPERRAILEVIRAFGTRNEREEQRRRRDSAIIKSLSDRISDALSAINHLSQLLREDGVTSELDVLKGVYGIGRPLLDAMRSIEEHIVHTIADTRSSTQEFIELSDLYEAASSDESEDGAEEVAAAAARAAEVMSRKEAEHGGHERP
jgi:hypothetical protein